MPNATDRTNNRVPSHTAKSNAADSADVLVWADPATHRLLVDALITLAGVQLNGNSTIGDGSKNVTTAGSRVQLSASSVPVKKVTVQAKTANTQNIYVGGSTIAAGRGIILLPFNSILLTPSDLNLVFIDSDVNGEGVTFTYEN